MEEVVDDPADREVDVALWRAAKHGDMFLLRSALAAGGDPNAEGLEPSMFEDGGQPALHMAVDGGHLEAVRALLKAGADTEFRISKSTMLTPLMIAVEISVPRDLYAPRRFLGIDDARDAVERRLLPIVVALIESGADVETSYDVAAGADGPSGKPLCCAVKHGRRRTLLTLLRAGASFETTERFELTFTGEEFPPPFAYYVKLPGEMPLRIFRLQDKRFEAEIVSIDGKPITAEFSSADLDAFIVNRHSAAHAGAPQPYRVGFFRRERYYSTKREPRGSDGSELPRKYIYNESTLALMKAIESAGSFDEYARRLQRDVHVAIITKCFQEKLPLDIKTALTTYLWKWGGA